MTPCLEHGCPVLVQYGRCPRHTPRNDRYLGTYQANRLRVLAASDICWRCHRPGATTADHVVPIAHGGTHDLSNLRPCHAACNSAAGATVRRQG
jgi:5-methylcytosine-specific restriction endonuclease McrA